MPHGSGISTYPFTINTNQSLYQAVLFAPFPRNQASLSENVVAPKESPLHCVLWFSLSCQAATVLVEPGWRGWFNSMLSESKLISATKKMVWGFTKQYVVFVSLQVLYWTYPSRELQRHVISIGRQSPQDMAYNPKNQGCGVPMVESFKTRPYLKQIHIGFQSASSLITHSEGSMSRWFVKRLHGR